jgi:hypothetical protein
MHRRYETGTPRIAVGFSAVAMTAITIGAMVVLPARMSIDSAEPVLAKQESILSATKVINEASASAVSYSVADYLAVHELAVPTGTCACDTNRDNSGARQDSAAQGGPSQASVTQRSSSVAGGASMRAHARKTKAL